MIEDLPRYVSVVFLITTLATVWFLFSAANGRGESHAGYRLLTFAVPLWLLLTGYLSTTDFYRQSNTFPPRVAIFGVLPAVLLIAAIFIFFRPFVTALSLRKLTLLHTVRIPVELVLLWLYQYGQVPRQMTFEGWNFDIISGLTAPFIAWLAFRNEKVKRPLLIVWNFIALGLLVNIVAIAILSFRSPMQQISFEQPNVGVTYLPFIWLPAIVVPIVLFAHLSVLYNSLRAPKERNV